MTALKLLLPLLICAIEAGFIDAFRSDYTYISSASAYYKYHKEGAKWADALSTCRSEGARLFHPDSTEELEQVWRTLAVDSGNYLLTGLSDLDKLGEYKTVDGRPISQVYDKWRPGEPSSCGGGCRCGDLHPSTHLLGVGGCHYPRRFICKHEEEVTATDVTTVAAANASYVASLEQQLANRTAALELMNQEATSLKLQLANKTAEMEAMKKVDAENQPSTLIEKVVVAIANQTAVIRDQDANQAAAFKQIAEAIANQTDAIIKQDANQAAAIKQLDTNQAAALDRLTEAVQRHAANQTAAVERQALAMEKLAAPPEQ